MGRDSYRTSNPNNEVCENMVILCSDAADLSNLIASSQRKLTLHSCKSMLSGLLKSYFYHFPSPSSLWSGQGGIISKHFIIASPSPTTHLASLHHLSPPALTLSALPLLSAIASAVPAPGGTSCRTFVQGKTSLVAARDSLSLI